ncbi:MAG: hypothetical protein HQL58_06895 [Magnetococcales bacterium]|nr:hypothetical protein [Magnetococcales bacterium]
MLSNFAQTYLDKGRQEGELKGRQEGRTSLLLHLTDIPQLFCSFFDFTFYRPSHILR